MISEQRARMLGSQVAELVRKGLLTDDSRVIADFLFTLGARALITLGHSGDDLKRAIDQIVSYDPNRIVLPGIGDNGTSKS